ncbi:uncharacterized protein LOC144181591 [Stigmatopora nigra]
MADAAFIFLLVLSRYISCSSLNCMSFSVISGTLVSAWSFVRSAWRFQWQRSTHSQGTKNLTPEYLFELNHVNSQTPFPPTHAVPHLLIDTLLSEVGVISENVPQPSSYNSQTDLGGEYHSTTLQYGTQHCSEPALNALFPPNNSFLPPCQFFFFFTPYVAISAPKRPQPPASSHTLLAQWRLSRLKTHRTALRFPKFPALKREGKERGGVRTSGPPVDLSHAMPAAPTSCLGKRITSVFLKHWHDGQRSEVNIFQNHGRGLVGVERNRYCTLGGQARVTVQAPKAQRCLP